jgi:hypothetical protein
MASILSLTEFFEKKLEAPMVNNRWSWGAVKIDGSAVYLSVWQDEIKRDDPKDSKSSTWVDVLWDEKIWSGVSGASTARNERIKHIDLIKSGVPAFVLIKISKDTNIIPREMREFNSEYLVGLKNNFRLTDAGILQGELGDRYPM